mmetsp:Transcript_13540/g.18734  ORF Transcript_13540/g.18734 Transcript_13540/m.18734 type:complete len:210 (-) Transcript_13540:318-947(-)
MQPRFKSTIIGELLWRMQNNATATHEWTMWKNFSARGWLPTITTIIKQEMKLLMEDAKMNVPMRNAKKMIREERTMINTETARITTEEETTDSTKNAKITKTGTDHEALIEITNEANRITDNTSLYWDAERSCESNLFRTSSIVSRFVGSSSQQSVISCAKPGGVVGGIVGRIFSNATLSAMLSGLTSLLTSNSWNGFLPVNMQYTSKP